MLFLSELIFSILKLLPSQGNALEFLDLGNFDENYDPSKLIDLNDDVIELSYYPKDNPYMVCFTFTPSITGSHKIDFSRVYTGDTDLEGTGFERVPTLFIY